MKVVKQISTELYVATPQLTPLYVVYNITHCNEHTFTPTHPSLLLTHSPIQSLKLCSLDLKYYLECRSYPVHGTG